MIKVIPQRIVTTLCLLPLQIRISPVAANLHLTPTNLRAMASFDSIPSVEIDPQGTYKYILIKLYEKNVTNEDGSEKFKYLVRGNARGEFHGDIYDAFVATLPKTLDTECVGGGRIKHNPDEKKILVYGYSQGFGKADHSISKQVLAEKYTGYTIDWSDEGY
uniref:Sex-regulated protein janus-A n=1 Tax=Cacopsylla melanoneura TaxID=428564 RepID=A0A8D8XZ84_9HEMI